MATTNGSRKSSSSSGTAKKSGTAAKKTASAAKTNSRSSKNAPRPIRREVGAAVCLFLAILSFIGCFDVDGWFIDLFCGVIQGVLGWGYYLFPPALVLMAITLAFHRGRPVGFRVFCCCMLPIMFGAMAHLLFSRTALELGGKLTPLIQGLYAEGKLMEGGGLIAGLLAIPDDYYEAAMIEGAGVFYRFIHITLPLIVPAFTSNVTLLLAWGLKLFDLPMAIARNMQAAETVTMFVYDNIFSYSRAGFGQAAAILFTIVLLILTRVITWLFRRKEVEL